MSLDRNFFHLNDSGQSIVQALMGLGLIAITAATFAQMYVSQQKQLRSLWQRSEALDLKAQLMTTLQNADVCACHLNPALTLDDSNDANLKFNSTVIDGAINTKSEELADKNIKGRAYDNLSEMILENKDSEKIKSFFSSFKSDYEKQKSDWIKSKISWLLININSKIEIKYYFSTFDLTAPSPRYKDNEIQITKYKKILEKMKTLEPQQIELVQFASIIYKDLHLWPALTTSAFEIIQTWLDQFKNLNVEPLIDLYFKFQKLIEDHKKISKNPRGQILITTNSSFEVVNSNQKLLKNIICSKRPEELKTNPKANYAYIYIIKGQSENQFNDQFETLKCP